MILSLLALSACAFPGGNTTKPAANAQTAIVYLQQARKLIAGVAQAVLPGAVLTQTVSDGPPSQCRSPLKGFTYFNITRDFQAPSGKTGSSMLPALVTELKARGFMLSPIETGGGYFDSASGTKDNSVGVAAMGSPTTRLVRIGVATQCGKPTPADEDVDLEPSPSPT